MGAKTMKRLPALLALLIALPAAAAPDCHRGNPATRDIVHCDEAILDAAQKRLDATYADFARGLDAYGAGLLSKAQQIWLTFRDANCEVADDPFRGGTAWAVQDLECRAAMTEARTRELAEQAEESKAMAEPPAPSPRR